MKTFFGLLISMCGVISAQIQTPGSGKIDLYRNFKSPYVTARNVEIWLPDGYSKDKKYAVLYMHDGQMLFDATTTWNKQSWEADDIVARLIKEGKIKDVIIVGIWNGESTRHSDYFPQKPFENLTPEQKLKITNDLKEAGRTSELFQPKSDNYLKFIVEELKPFVDSTYSVFTDRENTFIAGSSMGGLISMYAITQYPDVFGGAACISTHWPGTFGVENNPIPDAFARYIKDSLIQLNGNKIYFDYGNQTLDAFYPPLQKKVDEVMKDYPADLWKSVFFEGKDHSEKSWRERFEIPLLFLLGNGSTKQ